MLQIQCCAGIKIFFLMLWQPIWWHCNSINNLILMVIIKSFDLSSLIQKPPKLSSSSNSSWTTNSLDSMVFTDWGALQESPCCHSWGSCGQAFTEEGSHTQEVSSIKLILFMDWLVSHHGGIKIWSCFEPIWFCDCGHGLGLLQCQAIFEHAFFFSRYNRKKMSLQQRKARVAQKKAYFLKQQGDGEDEEEDDEWACQLK